MLATTTVWGRVNRMRCATVKLTEPMRQTAVAALVTLERRQVVVSNNRVTLDRRRRLTRCMLRRSKLRLQASPLASNCLCPADSVTDQVAGGAARAIMHALVQAVAAGGCLLLAVLLSKVLPVLARCLQARRQYRLSPIPGPPLPSRLLGGYSITQKQAQHAAAGIAVQLALQAT